MTEPEINKLFNRMFELGLCFICIITGIIREIIKTIANTTTNEEIILISNDVSDKLFMIVIGLLIVIILCFILDTVEEVFLLKNKS